MTSSLSRGALLASLSLALVVLAACAHHEAPLPAGNTAFVPARATAGMTAADAQRTVLLKAADLTVNHGFQYFRLLAAPAPGRNVPFKLFRQGDVHPGAPGVWDAQKLLTGAVRLPPPPPQQREAPPPMAMPLPG